ncbi:MAG: selenide, water dikinase SelD [Gemmatimonadaceae bacterium]
MGPGDLSRVLAGLPAQLDGRLVVGHETFDDAGVFVLSDDLALVQTVDFFAPIVDDPFAFGQIAAANALSDVYAMGGEPMTALNIVGFPSDKLPHEVLTEILRGGQEVVHDAGAVIVGGHTVIDEEVKYGLAVTGRADPRHLLTNAGARAGDLLFLSKAVGTGILATAGKRGELDADSERTMLKAMRTLNRDASRAALAVGARCATDVTGFGLLGHALHIARASGVSLHIDAGSVPILPGARRAWEGGARTGGAERNAEYLGGVVEWDAGVDAPTRGLFLDPQTSGGLLVALPTARAEEFRKRLPSATEIGKVVRREHSLITVSAP